MNRAYLFNSIHIGKAFANELEDLGYKYKDGWGWDNSYVREPLPRGSAKSILLGNDGKITIHNHQSFTTDTILFKLETQWLKALSDAKEKENRIKEGEWITRDGPGNRPIIFADKILDDGRTVKGYGFSLLGWTDKDTWHFPLDGKTRKATQKELHKAFLEEANERYSHGDLVEGPSDTPWKIIEGASSQVQSYGKEFVWGGCKIFNRGQWREKIEEKLEFFEHDVEIFKERGQGVVKISCTERSVPYLRNVLKDLKHFKEHKVQDVVGQLEKILKETENTEKLWKD